MERSNAYLAWMATTECGLYYQLDDFVIVGSKPTKILRDGAHNLHADGEAALEYADGWKLFALHGVRVPDEYALTPAEKISPETVLRETNADIRRELIRKIGVSRMLAKLPHKRMDKRGDYELLSINLGNGVTDARYLKMINPSIGCFHVEGIHPGLDTVEKALNWRNQQKFTDAEVLT